MCAAVKQISRGGRTLGTTPRKHTPKSPIDKATGYEVVWNQVGGLFEAARPFENPSFVYLVGEADDGPIKIGLSKDPIGRLRTMQTGNPRRLRIEYALIGALPLEKLLHEFWEPFAILSARRSARRTQTPTAAPGTEWFKPEAREALLPIIADAVNRQIELIASTSGPVGFDDCEQVVRDAHAESGFVAQGRDEVRRLGRHVGYAVDRPSRI